MELKAGEHEYRVTILVSQYWIIELYCAEHILKLNHVLHSRNNAFKQRSTPPQIGVKQNASQKYVVAEGILQYVEQNRNLQKERYRNGWTLSNESLPFIKRFHDYTFEKDEVWFLIVSSLVTMTCHSVTMIHVNVVKVLIVEYFHFTLGCLYAVNRCSGRLRYIIHDVSLLINTSLKSFSFCFTEHLSPVLPK